MTFHIIGDIHGHAEKLEALLRKLGYVQTRGTYRHPYATAIFVGDFIDRGPHQLETLNIVRRMVDMGSAQAVMGNHEFNAIAWQTTDHDATGEYLRPHGGPKGTHNRYQHQAFLTELQNQPALHSDFVAWFKTLPLWLDLPGLRVVHACWHEAHMQTLRPLVSANHQLTDDALLQASRANTPAFQAVETLLKGIEAPLPAGLYFLDKDGHKRHHVRLRWWLSEKKTYRDLGLMPDTAAQAKLPDAIIPADILPPPTSDKPLFFGHYWFSNTPAPLSATLACVDYSAGKQGPLVAYCWDGEPTLQTCRFITSTDN